MNDRQYGISILEERQVYANSFGRLHDDLVRFESSDKSGTYVRWIWNSPYSVAVLPIVGDRFGLVRAFRHSARGFTLEVPKGFGMEDQSPELTARNELKEETGLTAGSLVECGLVTSDPAFNHHPMHLFIALDCQAGASRPEISEEISSIEYYPFSEAHAHLSSSDGTVDAITMLLLHESKEHIR